MNTTTTPSDLIDRIVQLIHDSGIKNKNELAMIAIHVAIADGVDTETRLIGLLGKCGFKHGHIARMLDPKKGPYANADYWRIDAAGRYRLVEEGVPLP
jgi:hypothetical protein